MISEGLIKIGTLPASLAQALDRLEARGSSLSAHAVNIFNSKPPVREDIPDAYDGSGRYMVLSETVSVDEGDVLREILRQVEGVPPPTSNPPMPSDGRIKHVSKPTYVFSRADEVCNWQFPHRDGMRAGDAAVLVALSPRGANFMFWGHVDPTETIRRRDGQVVHLRRGEFVFFSHLQVHSGGAYAGANVRLYWSFTREPPAPGEGSTTVPANLTSDVREEEDDDRATPSTVQTEYIPSDP